MNKPFGKRIGGTNEDSSFHLIAPGNAVKRFSGSVSLEQGASTIYVEIGVSRSLILDKAQMCPYNSPEYREATSDSPQRNHTV